MTNTEIKKSIATLLSTGNIDNMDEILHQAIQLLVSSDLTNNQYEFEWVRSCINDWYKHMYRLKDAINELQ